jgi:hypothetical protein
VKTGRVRRRFFEVQRRRFFEEDFWILTKEYALFSCEVCWELSNKLMRLSKNDLSSIPV